VRIDKNERKREIKQAILGIQAEIDTATFKFFFNQLLHQAAPGMCPPASVWWQKLTHRVIKLKKDNKSSRVFFEN
jgi:hypothetical protein